MNKIKAYATRVSFLSLIIFSLSGCASGTLSIKQASFGDGFLHGLVFPFACLGRYVFRLNYVVYVEYNNGLGYLGGFLLGLATFICICVLIRQGFNHDND